MGVHGTFTGAERVAKRRAALRASGLRPKQIWLPDMRDPKVRADIRADAAALASQAHRWQAIVDDAEALSGEVLADLPPYDERNAPRGGKRRAHK
jgi:hypothetical protein